MLIQTKNTSNTAQICHLSYTQQQCVFSGLKSHSFISRTCSNIDVKENNCSKRAATEFHNTNCCYSQLWLPSRDELPHLKPFMAEC